MTGSFDVLYRQLVENVVDYAIFALDATGHILSWNPGAAAIDGYQTEEVLGQHYSLLFSEEDQATRRPAADLQRATREGRVQYEGWRRRKDGAKYWAHVALSAMRNAEGKVTGFAHVTRDLSAKRQAEEELKRANEGFRILVQSVKDYAILTLDPQGHVMSWNEGAERIKGYTAAEILGRPFTQFYPQEAIDSGYPQYELEVAAREGRFEDEGWRIRKDGTRFWANVIMTALHNDAGELIGFAKVTRDLTARRAAEEQARRLAAEEAAHAEAALRSQELQAALCATKAARDAAERSAAAATEAYRELDQFAYVASHDLKAPLRGIANLAQWIQDDVGEQLTGESAEHLRLLHGRVHRMEALIDGILAYSRAGRVKSQPEAVDTGALVREVIELLAPAPQAVIRLPEEMPLLQAERVPLQQVFMNLLSNALKYASAERSDPVVELECHDLGESVEFVVRDNGPGIAPEYHDRIWGIFQTLAPRDKVEGTGIGLSVVKKIVESRGGSVSLESAAGQGATFRVIWPKTTQWGAAA